ncbi:uncharacterized protein LOC117789605 [Drosophila innubila]|uniref:uncharacterized protein LOC117789605 n=1 Tax=Drosophila innubila TaxID=198719 RepID=UPI00148DF82B|nr:uncharacterized protein LOC117789605 [Drosophila innubila]
MSSAFCNKSEMESEQPVDQENLNLDKDEPIIEVDSKLSLKNNILFKHKNQLEHSHLAKLILPKDALEVLQQCKDINISNVNIEGDADGNFIANVNVNSKQYTAKGHSKKEAKKLVCELAFRDYIISKDLSSDDETSKMDVTILHLASFAIYKLCEEWNRDGYVAPLAESSMPASMCNKLPAKWETMHPASVLHVMRPGLKYIPIDGQPNGLQCMTIVVDNQEFISYGRSKKIARRNVAIAACNALFSTNFRN